MTLVSEFEKNRLNSPNDAVVRSDGSIYFTDPPYGLTGIAGTKGVQELSFQGVYRIMPDSSTLELIVDDIHRPNGIALSPNEEVLYVANTQSPASILAFDIKSDGTIANRRTFVQLDGWDYPDGITVDLSGNLYVTTNSFLLKIYSSTGKYLGNINIPEGAANCTFGGSDYKTLFVTANTSVYRVQMKVKGRALF